MESSASAESEALLDRMTDSLTKAMRVSEQDECPDSQSTGAHSEQEDDAFFDCKESLDGADASRGERQRRTKAPVSCQEPDGDCKETVRLKDSQSIAEEHKGELAELSEEGTTVLGAEEGDTGGKMEGEEEKESWDECTEEDKSVAVEGEDPESELKDESVAPEFDEEYLREAEKDLTEEEKQSRREESMTLKNEGNSQFKSGGHSEAEGLYTASLGVCPVCFSQERAVLFSNRAAARMHLDMNEKAIADCTKAIELNPSYMRAILRRAELYEKTDKLDEALEDYKSALEKDPSLPAAREACMRLPQQIHERNEKLKEEMMSKLKDLGNMFLRPFGLSTSNFQVNQDSNSGSYSVNFVQNNNNR
ncbi:hypothetical protein DPEC_G00227560 [Dallia pectoralis]|uniref:Uncharacterized protein n=1 Tax=Dallia pectoralis TaxID=75939 RepID=A0ACC2G117_DALPE|nr:hypothetical protein DPEC_G00227560 [Dallia pectoralis]